MLLPNGEQSFLEQNNLLRLLFQSPGHHKGEVGAHLRYVKEPEVVARVVFPGGGSHLQRQTCQQPGKPCSTHLNFTLMRFLTALSFHSLLESSRAARTTAFTNLLLLLTASLL